MLRHVVLSLGLVLLLPTGSLAAGGSGATPRAATEQEVGYFRYVTSAAEAPGSQRTTTVARCPVGTQATGGGVRSTGESAQDAVVTSAPFDSRDADKSPDDGWIGVVVSGSDQLMVTSAVCAPFEVSYVTRTRRVPRRADRRLDVPCPDQMFPTGGGAESTGTSRRIMLGESGAGQDVAGWRVRLENGSRHREKLTAYAVCMRMPQDFSHSGWSQRLAQPGVTTELSGVDACALNAEHVTGGGPLFIGSRAGHVLDTSPADGTDEDFAPDDGWTTKVYNETNAALTLRSTRVCLP